MSRVSQTCESAKADSSLRTSASVSAGWCGTTRLTSTAVRTPIAATSQYAERQPACWPSQVASGTPATLAMGMPSMIRLTAQPPRPGATMSKATIEAMPKKAPCGMPATSRASMSSG